MLTISASKEINEALERKIMGDNDLWPMDSPRAKAYEEMVKGKSGQKNVPERRSSTWKDPSGRPGRG